MKKLLSVKELGTNLAASMCQFIDMAKEDGQKITKELLNAMTFGYGASLFKLGYSQSEVQEMVEISDKIIDEVVEKAQNEKK